MGTIQVKVTDTMEAEIDEYLEESGGYLNRAEMIRDAIRQQLRDHQAINHGDQQTDPVQSDQVSKGKEELQPNAHRNAFREFSKRAMDEYRKEIHEIILFGSVARGEEQGIASDVDIYVVVDAETPKRSKKIGYELRDIGYEVMITHSVPVTTIIDTRNEYERKKEDESPLIKNIEQEGERYE